MTLNFNPTILSTAIYTLVNADSILQGSTYLNGTEKIFSFRAPRDIIAPFAVIECLEFLPDDMSLYQSEVRVHIYCKILSNGQVDVATGNRIINRFELLLNGEILSLSSGGAMPLRSIGITPMMYDEMADGAKAKSVLRLFAEVSST